MSSGDCRLKKYNFFTLVGGTTAAFAAAISSASEGVTTCLLEPTDWIGGQMTASGVPAIDFEWRNLKDGNVSYNIAKMDKVKNIFRIYKNRILVM